MTSSEAKREINIALIQMSISMGDKEANISKAENLIDETVEKYNPDIVALPEFFSTEYFPQWLDRKYFKYAEPIPGPTIERIARKASEHGIYIIAPIYEEVEPGVYYDSSPMIGPDGKIVGIYRKVTTGMVYWPEGGDISYEPYYFRTGSEFPVFKTDLGNVGQLICYDRHFPEHWRILVLKGAETLIIPVASAGGAGTRGFGRLNLSESESLAYTNQCFVAQVNRVGTEGKFNFYGSSHVIDPAGQILAGPASNKKEEIICARLDLDEVTNARLRCSFLRDRRPEIYGPLIEGQPVKHVERKIYKYFQNRSRV